MAADTNADIVVDKSAQLPSGDIVRDAFTGNKGSAEKMWIWFFSLSALLTATIAKVNAITTTPAIQNIVNPQTGVLNGWVAISAADCNPAAATTNVAAWTTVIETGEAFSALTVTPSAGTAQMFVPIRAGKGTILDAINVKWKAKDNDGGTNPVTLEAVIVGEDLTDTSGAGFQPIGGNTVPIGYNGTSDTVRFDGFTLNLPVTLQEHWRYAVLLYFTTGLANTNGWDVGFYGAEIHYTKRFI